MKASSALIALSGLILSLSVGAADDKAVESALKKNKCTTCHSADKKKVGPSYKEIAAKYKGNADAEQAIVTHLSTSPNVDVGGGKQQPHPSVKKATDEQLRAVAQYILSK